VGTRGKQGEIKMERRKFLIGAGSAAVGSSALIGSGAFASVDANRDVDLRVATDQNAYLGFEVLDSDYASMNDGVIEFSFMENGEGGEGLNGVADTYFEDVFKIVNQGTNTVNVWVATYNPEAGGNQSVEMIVGSGSSGGDTDLTYPSEDLEPADKSNQPTSGNNSTTPGGYVTLDSGQSRKVDFQFFVSGANAPRAWEDKTYQFRADVEAPDAISDWQDSSLPTHQEAQTEPTETPQE
jgi:hypothetical protein